jgi:hypothetical protein
MVDARDRYLIRQGEAFAFRIAVPSTLRAHFKTRNITIGLRTKDPAEARKRRDQHLAEWRARFGRAGAPLDIAGIEAEALRVYTALLAEMAQRPPSGVDLDGNLDQAEAAIEAARTPLARALAEARWQALQGRLD